MSIYGYKLGKGLIKNVQKLETRKGVIIVIDYLADSQELFEAAAFINPEDYV